ncbi:MAG: 4Fe-4S dicluster domain-containing protein [Dehalococcoidia bacterium]|nr:4Fe-4S dicluster domain-containing protein [Dehalococcoidia bacterium]
MKYSMIVDINRCSVCYACVVACKNEHVGNPYPPYSYPQPDRDQEWIRLMEEEKGKYPYVKLYPIPVLCMHCNEAPCMEACPIPDCIYRTKEGAVIIDSTKCDGCKSCISACPYGVIFPNEDRNICQKCTLCMHRLEQGKEPACVEACPSGVFLWGEESGLEKEMKKREAMPLYREKGTKPRVYYVGLPTPTLAGHVIDGKSLMDMPGADVIITDTRGSSMRRKSNVAGNFSLDNLKMDTAYTVKIEHTGYLSKTIENVLLDIEYKHLGDIKLFKAS